MHPKQLKTPIHIKLKGWYWWWYRRRNVQMNCDGEHDRSPMPSADTINHNRRTSVVRNTMKNYRTSDEDADHVKCLTNRTIIMITSVIKILIMQGVINIACGEKSSRRNDDKESAECHNSKIEVELLKEHSTWYILYCRCNGNAINASESEQYAIRQWRRWRWQPRDKNFDAGKQMKKCNCKAQHAKWWKYRRQYEKCQEVMTTSV